MNGIQRFERNTAGRDLIVGDVHGHFTKLKEALDAVAFDPARDRLFSVGDLVDRGPESDKVLEWLALPWFHAVQGNHEDMAIDWGASVGDRDLYFANGGGWNISNPSDVQREIAEELSALPLAIELETACGLVGIVHADCPRDDWHCFTIAITGGEHSDHSELECQHLRTMALWNRQRIEMGDRRGVDGIRAVVVGHTPVPEHTVLGNVHYIDTGAWLGDRCPWVPRFTLLDAATLEVVKP